MLPNWPTENAPEHDGIGVGEILITMAFNINLGFVTGDQDIDWNITGQKDG